MCHIYQARRPVATARWNIARTRARTRRGLRGQMRLKILRIAGRFYPRPSPPPSPHKILLLRPDHLGDVLLTTPAIRTLRQSLPDSHLAALVGPWSQPVLAHNPDLDEIITLPFPGFTRRPPPSPLAPYRQLVAEANRLRKMHFDTALVLRPDHWWGAWLAAAARIPSRPGFDVPETRPFLTRIIANPPDRPEAERNLALVRTLLGPEAGGSPARPPLVFPIPPGTPDRLPPDPRPTVAIHPGSGAAVKLWREEGWAQVGEALEERLGARVVLTGSAAEREMCNRIARQMLAGGMKRPPLNLAGQTSLTELAAVYRDCRLVLGPDSGPLHLAVAVGTPTLHLFGPADPAMYGPWRGHGGDEKRHRVLAAPMACAPCRVLDWTDLENHPCVREISAEAVIQAAVDPGN